MQKMLLLLILMTLSLSSGCATAPPAGKNVTSNENKRIIYRDLTKPPEEKTAAVEPRQTQLLQTKEPKAQSEDKEPAETKSKNNYLALIGYAIFLLSLAIGGPIII